MNSNRHGLTWAVLGKVSKDVEWSSHAEDRERVALLHIDAYRAGKARQPVVPVPDEDEVREVEALIRLHRSDSDTAITDAEYEATADLLDRYVLGRDA